MYNYVLEHWLWIGTVSFLGLYAIYARRLKLKQVLEFRSYFLPFFIYAIILEVSKQFEFYPTDEVIAFVTGIWAPVAFIIGLVLMMFILAIAAWPVYFLMFWWKFAGVTDKIRQAYSKLRGQPYHA